MYKQSLIESLNQDIKNFGKVVSPITSSMKKTRKGVSRLVMLDRYSFKDLKLETLKEGDLVIAKLNNDPKFPKQGIGYVQSIFDDHAELLIEEEFWDESTPNGIIVVPLGNVAKPLELFYEQISERNARGLARGDKNFLANYAKQLKEDKIVPAGRVIHSAGTNIKNTFFNCYVMPYIHDSREGLANHRKEVMEIMSRGGGVGTNGSTLRPKSALARGVNGKSSGSVSWLDDLAKLTHLVEQGGSRKGAQMIMLKDWHPDVVEFIISKMQNPRILRKIIEELGHNDIIAREAKNKLKFTAAKESELYEKQFLIASSTTKYKELTETLKTVEDKEEKEKITKELALLKGIIKDAKEFVKDGGTYSVHNPEFLTGANISVAITHEFMKAVKNNSLYDLRFPDVDKYTEKEMAVYNEQWSKIGDVRTWEQLGYGVKVYERIKAKDLWDLINICATFAAEPGIFFIDNANEMTNATAYGQEVVSTNPCGEQPLAPYSVCNLAAINLAEFASFESPTIDWEGLKEAVRNCVEAQDNVIDETPYFLKANEIQAKGERRAGLGVMGLADLLIYVGVEYGSEESLPIISEIFETIAITAYEKSIDLAKTRGSFPFLEGKTYVETMALRHKFINTGFMKKMPDHIREGILKNGIRNSHLLTVAPTGTTGTMVGVATGLEPYFGFTYFRSGRLGQFIEVKAEIVQEYLRLNPEVTELPSYFKAAMDLSPEQHVNVQCVIQRWIDSSISKTVNAPKGYTVEQVAKIYEMLHEGGAKGGTVYVDGSRDSQVLSLKSESDTSQEVEDLLQDLSTDNVDVKVVNLEPKEVIGSEVGNTCAVCKKGKVIKAGGCNTCDNCNAQLACGM